MGGGPGRHAELATELAEWWDDLWRAHIGSRVVLVSVPAGWGRSTALDRFRADITSRNDAPVSLTVGVNGEDLRGDTIGIQAEKLRACLSKAGRRHRAAELLGMDKLSGQAQLALGVGGLLLSGPLAGVAFLLAGLAVGAVGKAWDDSPAGQDGALARAARAVAAVSVDAPVVVIIDDADDVNEGLAVTLVDNLTARHNSQVLIVAAVNPGSAVAAALRARARYGLTDRLVYVAEADPDMGYESRLELARQLSTHLPDVATRRIAQRTTTFGEVFTVAAAPRLAELGHEADEALLAVVDAAVDARLARPVPSREAVVIAWAGGVVHARQADRALGILGAARVDDDPDVRRWESLERLADSADPRLADQVVVDLRAADRRALATAFLGEALSIARTAGTSLVDKVAALQAVHRVRADLAGRGQLPRAQCELVAALEVLGDAAAALQVATEAQSEWTAGKKHRRERDRLAAAVIRLSRLTPDAAPGPLAEQLIAEAVAGGAVVGLEARIWAAIVLLDTADQRSAALALAEKITGDIEGRPGLGTAGDRWRLLLGYHVGRAGQPALTTRLLAPLITSSDPEVQKEARMVRRAVDRPGADIRLQNILLEAELDTLPLGADDDRLRIHHALSENYADLGDYRQAAAHGQQELELRTSIHGARHPGTLVIRHNVADWIGWSGDAAGALRLFRGLLRDHEQVLGPLHPGTLATRAGIASWTGACGDAEEALRLYQKLLPVQEDVLGRRHPDSLKTRHNIAYWTRSCDDPATALCLYQDLLPEREDVIGPRHPDTLATRHEIAGATGDNGNPEKALRLYRELLPDREDVIGPRHPDTLATRNNIAVQIGNCGHPEEALRLFSDLLPDQQWVVGTRHPDTLATRANVAYWTGECGNAQEALRLYRELLPDREDVLGPNHPDTLITRAEVAHWTGECGNPGEALRLYRDLLPKMEDILGPDHPSTLLVRQAMTRLTRGSGATR